MIIAIDDKLRRECVGKFCSICGKEVDANKEFVFIQNKKNKLFIHRPCVNKWGNQED